MGPQGVASPADEAQANAPNNANPSVGFSGFSTSPPGVVGVAPVSAPSPVAAPAPVSSPTAQSLADTAHGLADQALAAPAPTISAPMTAAQMAVALANPTATNLANQMAVSPTAQAVDDAFGPNAQAHADMTQAVMNAIAVQNDVAEAMQGIADQAEGDPTGTQGAVSADSPTGATAEADVGDVGIGPSVGTSIGQAAVAQGMVGPSVGPVGAEVGDVGPVGAEADVGDVSDASPGSAVGQGMAGAVGSASAAAGIGGDE